MVKPVIHGYCTNAFNIKWCYTMLQNSYSYYRAILGRNLKMAEKQPLSMLNLPEESFE